MANDITQRGVLILDTAADNIIAAGKPVNVAYVKFIAPGGAAGNVQLTDAGSTAVKLMAAAPASGTDDIPLPAGKPVRLNGLRALTLTAGSLALVYTS